MHWSEVKGLTSYANRLCEVAGSVKVGTGLDDYKEFLDPDYLREWESNPDLTYAEYLANVEAGTINQTGDEMIFFKDLNGIPFPEYRLTRATNCPVINWTESKFRVREKDRRWGFVRQDEVSLRYPDLTMDSVREAQVEAYTGEHLLLMGFGLGPNFGMMNRFGDDALALDFSGSGLSDDWNMFEFMFLLPAKTAFLQHFGAVLHRVLSADYMKEAFKPDATIVSSVRMRNSHFDRRHTVLVNLEGERDVHPSVSYFGGPKKKSELVVCNSISMGQGEYSAHAAQSTFYFSPSDALFEAPFSPQGLGTEEALVVLRKEAFSEWDPNVLPTDTVRKNVLAKRGSGDGKTETWLELIRNIQMLRKAHGQIGFPYAKPGSGPFDIVNDGDFTLRLARTIRKRCGGDDIVFGPRRLQVVDGKFVGVTGELGPFDRPNEALENEDTLPLQKRIMQDSRFENYDLMAGNYAAKPFEPLRLTDAKINEDGTVCRNTRLGYTHDRIPGAFVHPLAIDVMLMGMSSEKACKTRPIVSHPMLSQQVAAIALARDIAFIKRDKSVSTGGVDNKSPVTVDHFGSNGSFIIDDLHRVANNYAENYLLWHNTEFMSSALHWSGNKFVGFIGEALNHELIVRDGIDAEIEWVEARNPLAYMVPKRACIEGQEIPTQMFMLDTKENLGPEVADMAQEAEFAIMEGVFDDLVTSAQKADDQLHPILVEIHALLRERSGHAKWRALSEQMHANATAVSSTQN